MTTPHKTSLRNPLLSILVVALVFGAAQAGAVDSEQERQKLLDEIRTLIDVGDWKKAEKRVGRVERIILHESKSLPSDRKDLATLALYRAVVAANMNRDDESLWFWYTAMEIDIPTSRRDISAWGRAADVLGDIAIRAVGSKPDGVLTIHDTRAPGFEPPGIPSPNVPRSLDGSHDDRRGRIISVELLLGKDGRPSEPRLTGPSHHPMFVYAWMQGAFEKRWKAAELDGEPVALLVRVSPADRAGRW